MDYLIPYLLDWANLLVRWLHLIAGIAWIGASFYFVMLDTSLRAPRRAGDAERGVHGELWAVHGGGFYCSQKFLTGPRGEPLAENLHWSKWEAYSTWLSGMGMLAIVYWLGAPGTLVDSRVADLSPAQAVAASVAFLAVGWLLYDSLCRWLEGRERLLTLLVAVLALGADALAHQLFAARAAYLHVGAMLGTCMAANVFIHIIPGQKRMVAALRAGQPVDPRPGRIGKQRSVHNTYFTLPVLFTMISNHFPMTFGHQHSAVVLGVVMAAGMLIRQFFVLRHSRGPVWWLPAVALGLLLGLVVWMAPSRPASGHAALPDEGTVTQLVATHCQGCHATHPTQPGFLQAPKGIVLEQLAQLRAHAPAVATALASGYMPLGNLNGMSDGQRQQLLAWVRAQRSPNED